jgi:hypothetical protein
LNTTGKKLQIILGSHVHVPYGAGDDEFEKAYSLRLKPFISALYKFPEIQGTLHYSGALLNWVDRVYPECTMSIDDLVSRKQVELLGGGFYEPQFSLIPLQDKIGQVEMLTTYLRRRFGKKPQGCWLPALGWEQNLVSPLAACGMAYTFLEEDKFRQAGLPASDFYAPCITEDQGKVIAVFPVSRTLEETFAPQEEAVALFLGAMEKLANGQGDDRVVVLFPDPCRAMASAGEAELYWHRFFEGLTGALGFLDFTTPGRFIKGKKGLKKAYFPDSAVRQHLVDFPEANGIYAKMVFSHMLINQLRGDKPRKRIALEELWKAQGYDAFCPAESGGVYRGDLRKSSYRSMLEAEKISRETGAFIPSLMNFDFDLDNEEEYLFQGERINCYIRLEGASVFELDYLPRSWNYLDTLGRRASFSDLLIPEAASLDDVFTGQAKGIRCCGEELFDAVDMDKTRGKVSFILKKKDAGPFASIEIAKSYQLRKDTLTVNYTLNNRGDAEERLIFSPAIELSFPGEGEDYQRLFANGAPIPASQADVSSVDILKFQDLKNETIVTLGSNKTFDVRITPVHCPQPGVPSYQSTCVLPQFKAALAPGESWGVVFTLKFTN